MARIAEMFHPRLGEQPSMKRLLIRHAGLMGGELIEHGIAGCFTAGRGRGALPPRLVPVLRTRCIPGDGHARCGSR